ncbi:glycoside hydrolase family 5 protein [Gloeopeniophorella convolvens]|nr:glycoside hydrolase family 5 protein [Gloeopeniophorella convolvens]
MQLFALSIYALALLRSVGAAAPKKIYGTNLGSWLVLEPWMLPQGWIDMGGQICNDCSTCIATESAFAAAYPNTVDQKFAEHWSTWFTQDDVDKLKGAGMNTVRVPLGYWIVEDLVDRRTEHYPRGGIEFLSNGLKMLRDAGIQAILDHHALPGVQTPGQMFTGNCTSDVQFYTVYNYGRALTWTVVMTVLSHTHPNFESVFSLQAANEPIMDAAKTPGYGDFQKNFVRTVRATELLLGIEVPGYPSLGSAPASSDMSAIFAHACTTDNSGLFSNASASVKAITEAIPILLDLSKQLGPLKFGAGRGRAPLTTNFMDVLWQHDSPSNPADAAIGPQSYDDHLYYRLALLSRHPILLIPPPLNLNSLCSFGGVAASADPDAYLQNLCNRPTVQKDEAAGDSPMWFGEWALSTQFNATDDFLRKWADAQKLVYSQGAGWLFWNFKIEKSTLAGDLARQWSYFEALDRNYFTQDPSQLHDPHVCDPYRNISATGTTQNTKRRDASFPISARHASRGQKLHKRRLSY